MQVGVQDYKIISPQMFVADQLNNLISIVTAGKNAVFIADHCEDTRGMVKSAPQELF